MAEVAAVHYSPSSVSRTVYRILDQGYTNRIFPASMPLLCAQVAVYIYVHHSIEQGYVKKSRLFAVVDITPPAPRQLAGKRQYIEKKKLLKIPTPG